ncbi:MAG: acetate--CoA ligase family protein [Spirochaetota bacterium]
MNTLFYPRSVMVVGVSNDPVNLGRSIVQNLDRFKFSGPVYCVGKDGGYLGERKIYTSIEAVDAVPDLAVFLIPARYIPGAMDACGRKGIRYAVIETAGFTEFAEEGRNLEDQLRNAAKQWNIRFVGPNCISIINLENGLVLPFVSFYQPETKLGHISLASQSGGVVVDSVRLLSLENLGFNKLISMGNKLDLNENNFFEYLVSDPGTHIIGLYLEHIVDGRLLMNIAYQSNKPIIILKSNIADSSRNIAMFHSTALAGDNTVADSAFRQAGLFRVNNMREMMDNFKIFSLPPLKGPRLGLLCRSGGQGVMLADSAYRHGFALSRFSDDFFAFVKKEVRAGVIRLTNPLDMGDVFNLQTHIEIMKKALQEKDVDGLVFSHAYIGDWEVQASEDLIRAARDLSLAYRKPVVITVVPKKQEWFSMKEAVDFPVFSEADDAIRALGNSLHHFTNLSLPGWSRKRIPLCNAGKVPGNNDSRKSSRLLGPGESYRLLALTGLPVADYRVVRDVKEGVKAASEIGYPVAVKIAEPNVLHKTEEQGVKLNIADAAELERIINDMNGEEFLIQKMAGTGLEVIIGGKQDNEFGPIILFGLGGIFVEVMKDVAIRVAPVEDYDAESMIADTHGARLLEGFRGQPPADKAALKKCLMTISRLLYDHLEITNLDINPMIVHNDGMGCVIVDAKIEVSE